LGFEIIQHALLEIPASTTTAAATATTTATATATARSTASAATVSSARILGEGAGRQQADQQKNNQSP
jgi:hypothetical protein